MEDSLYCHEPDGTEGVLIDMMRSMGLDVHDRSQGRLGMDLDRQEVMNSMSSLDLVCSICDFALAASSKQSLSTTFS